MERLPAEHWPSRIPRPVAPHVFRTNARIYASERVIALLTEVATHARLAILVDVDALERSALARVDRVILLALDALCQLNVQIVLLARAERERAQRMRDRLPLAWCDEHTDARQTTVRVRERMPHVPLIGISDDPALLGELTERDRGILLGDGVRASATIATTSALHVRAALWWIVDVRWKAGLSARI